MTVASTFRHLVERHDAQSAKKQFVTSTGRLRSFSSRTSTKASIGVGSSWAPAAQPARSAAAVNAASAMPREMNSRERSISFSVVDAARFRITSGQPNPMDRNSHRFEMVGVLVARPSRVAVTLLNPVEVHVSVYPDVFDHHQSAVNAAATRGVVTANMSSTVIEAVACTRGDCCCLKF